MLIDFSELTPPRRPNWCLALPEAWKGAHAKLSVPSFPVARGRLREATVHAIREEPRTNLIRLDKQARQAEFEQRSAIFGFADRVVIEFVELGPEESSLAIYSRSKTGYWDLGVNCRRIRRWLAAVASELEENTEK